MICGPGNLGPNMVLLGWAIGSGLKLRFYIKVYLGGNFKEEGGDLKYVEG